MFTWRQLLLVIPLNWRSSPLRLIWCYGCCIFFFCNYCYMFFVSSWSNALFHIGVRNKKLVVFFVCMCIMYLSWMVCLGYSYLISRCVTHEFLKPCHLPEENGWNPLEQLLQVWIANLIPSQWRPSLYAHTSEMWSHGLNFSHVPCMGMGGLWGTLAPVGAFY